ncbi:MAG: hypothetical protein V4724_22680 [Pseudomonadota bacterium]
MPVDIPYNDLVSIFIKFRENLDRLMQILISRVNQNPEIKNFINAYLISNEEFGRAMASRLRAKELTQFSFNYLHSSEELISSATINTAIDFSDIFPEAEKIIIDQKTKMTELNMKSLEARQKDSLFENEDKKIKDQIEIQRINLKKLNDDFQNLSKTFSDTYDPLTKKYNEAIESYEKHITYLENKKTEIDQLLEHVGGKAIAGSYDDSASEEKNTANTLRFLSLIIMGIALSIVGYSFVEINKHDFNLENTLLRLTFTILLSIPAAYLARESAKHRQQQYTHHQTSLDLKAISPYIASLPIEIQNKLKEEMATKIFTPKTFDHITKESYPINTQEIIMSLLSKFGENEKSKKQ